MPARRDALLSRLNSTLPLLRRRFAEVTPVHARAQLHAQLGDLTAIQLQVLVVLHQDAGPAGLTMHELGSRLGISASSTSQLIDRLERAGFVERTRESEDRRVVRVTVTPSARERFDVLVERRMAALASLTAGLSTAELATFVGLLERMAVPQEVSA